MKHTASARFWDGFEKLPADIQRLARKNYALLRANPAPPSLHFKTLGGSPFYSVRIGLHHRALGIPMDGGVHWFWIGTHAEYGRLMG
ncbi:type II toxin-antitoxin system RelE family toxin [Ramlibacter humi]|uniref:ParE-like toxin domain-containing protein n=1 Tax=Ramlibacter humi TaxID=2530451 RepID=A0A4Z0CB27_9BURK|nr:hypothetical protein [Ramlibacter humi]TFZ08867.1 hypothetical protein EZ216_06915 [Ramlibacter humi]